MSLSPDFRIFIPTYKRVHRQLTYDKLPTALQRKTLLVVHEDELDEHRRRGRPAVASALQGLGMAAVRGWIVDYARASGIKRIAILDDDLTLQYRGEDMKILNSTGAQQIEAMEWMDKTLKQYASCAMGVRFLGYAEPGEVMENSRQMQAIGVNVERLHKLGVNFNKDVPVWFPMDDFHLTLQLLEAGEPNVVSLRYRTCPAPANAPGGCSEQRTLQRQNESAQLLARLHPENVKVREKKAWRGMDGTMYDVTVQWKMAYKRSQRRNG